jgi:hypothetical protein
MSTLSRNARRRLALYGGAALVIAALFALPRYLASRVSPIHVRRLDLEAAAAMDSPEVKLLAEVVRIDTSNPPGITRPVIDVFARELSCAGIPYVLTGSDPGRPILVARLAGRRRGEALALLAHADVDPVEDPSAWVRPPFSAVLGAVPDAANMVGRGTLDMKGQAVANLLALTALARSGIVPARDILFVIESGEESYDASLGFGWLLEHRPDLVAGVTDVFNEGGVNEVKTTEIERFGIEVMQKAILSVDVLAAARQPLEDLATVVKARDEAEPLKVVPAVRDFLRFIAPSRSDVWGRRMIEDPGGLPLRPEGHGVLGPGPRAGRRRVLHARREDASPGLVRGCRGGGARRLALGAGADEKGRPEDRRLRRVSRRGARLARRDRGPRARRHARARRAVRAVRPVHVELLPEGPRTARVRRLAVRRELLRSLVDSPRERTDLHSVLPRRGRADEADPVRVCDVAVTLPAATLRARRSRGTRRSLLLPRRLNELRAHP